MSEIPVFVGFFFHSWKVPRLVSLGLTVAGEDIPLGDNSGRLLRASEDCSMCFAPARPPGSSRSLHVEISSLLLISNSTSSFYLHHL